MTAVARTPLHDWHAAAGARFADLDGWQVPAAYAGAERETAAAAAGLALADVSAFAKVSLLTWDESTFNRILPAGSPASRPGGVALLAAENPVLACRLTADHLLLLATAPGFSFRADGLTLRAARGSLEGSPDQGPLIVRDVTCSYAGFCLLGPRPAEELHHLTPLDVSPAAFPAGSCAETSLAGVHALLVHPPAGSSPPSVRGYVAWDLAEYVWGRVVEIGRHRGLTPLGHDALGLLTRPAAG
jgi:glycine cleavage system aminomethyltransferase T